jgi:hypothetical protein
MGLLSIVALTSTPVAGQAQERSFHGIHAGLEASREDFIGGAFVDGVDFLAQDTRGVISLAGGVRYQTSSGLVLGLEGTWGATDGNLELDDPGRGLTIAYGNSSQTSIGGTVGFALERSVPILFFAYASEVTRDFEVSVTQDGTSLDQEDEQGMLRYGGGVEIRALNNLHVRLKIGTGRADFGAAETNITPKKIIQFGFGVTYQF